MNAVCTLCRGTFDAHVEGARFCDECASCMLLNGADVTPRRWRGARASSSPLTLRRNLVVDAVTPRRRRTTLPMYRKPHGRGTPTHRRRSSPAAAARSLTPSPVNCKPEDVAPLGRTAATVIRPPQPAVVGPSIQTLDGVNVTPRRASRGTPRPPTEHCGNSLADEAIPLRRRPREAAREPLSVIRTLERPPTTRAECRRYAYSNARCSAMPRKGQGKYEAENVEPQGMNASFKHGRGLLREDRGACDDLSQHRSGLQRPSHRAMVRALRATSLHEGDVALGEGRPRKRQRTTRTRSLSPSGVRETPPSTRQSQEADADVPQSPITRLLELFNEAEQGLTEAGELPTSKMTCAQPGAGSYEIGEQAMEGSPPGAQQSATPAVVHACTAPTPRFFVLDTETSGLDAGKHRVIEVAVAPYGGDEEPLSVLVNAGNATLDPESAAVHGITRRMLENAHSFPAVWERLRAYIALRTGPDETPVIVAHNASFDAEFLATEARRARRGLPSWHWACTVQLARILWPAQDLGLAALARRLGVARQGPAHRAANDVRTLRAVLRGMSAVGEARGMDVLGLLDAAARPMEQFARAKVRGAATMLPQSESYNESAV